MNGSPNAAILSAAGIHKRFGALVVLDDIDFAMQADEAVGIVGPNGAGKTTLVNVLTGLLKPSGGVVRFKGDDIAGIGPVKLAQRGMARAFQLVHIFPALTVGETIAVAVISHSRRSLHLFASLRRDEALWRKVREVAAIFGLDGKLESEARLLSQGEKKLLDIASAFALVPEVILLDEPTSGVSSGDKHAIMRTLIEAAGRAGVKAIILVEHDMDLVAEYASRIVALQAGKVLADRAPDAFFSDPALIDSVIGKRAGKRSRSDA